MNYKYLFVIAVYHWCDVRMKMYLNNIIRTKDSIPIPKLNEQAAIELGANLLGQSASVLCNFGYKLCNHFHLVNYY